MQQHTEGKFYQVPPAKVVNGSAVSELYGQLLTFKHATLSFIYLMSVLSYSKDTVSFHIHKYIYTYEYTNHALQQFLYVQENKQK